MAGFGLITFAVYQWDSLVGLGLAGLFLLLIGYVFEDDKAAVSIARAVHPIVRRWELRKVKRQAKDSR